MNGSLTVGKRNVTLTSATDSKAYDGETLTNGEVTVTGDGWAEDEGATYDVTGSQNVVGSSPNSFTYALNDGTKADNYTITRTEGNLTVTNRDAKYEISPQANSGAFKYDGTEKTVSGFVTDTFTVEGNTYTVSGLTATATGTDAGTYTVNVTGTAAVKDSDGIDVTGQFSVTPQTGTLTISKREVTLTSATDAKEYDGAALTNNEVTVTGDGFAEGEGATCDVTGTRTLVGTSDNTFTYTLKDNTKADNYTITTNNGTLTVNNRNTRYSVTLTANSGEFKYDGTEKTVTGWTIDGTAGGSFTAENGLTYTVSGMEAGLTRTDAGSYDVTVNGTPVVKDADGNDVTAQFAVSVEKGALTISRRSVTLTSATDSKAYDGAALTNDAVNVTGDGWANGEGATYAVTGSQTLPGVSVNAFTYALNEGTKAENYTVAKTEGSLTVTDRTDSGADRKYEITVKARSGTAAYDGTAHTVSGFETLAFTVNGVSYTVSGLEATATGTDAGTYPVNVTGTAVVKDDHDHDLTAQFIVNTVNGSLTVSKADITPAVTIEGWTSAETPNEPSVTGNPGNGAVTYAYRPADSTDEEAWNAEAPNEAGEYTVRAVIDATDNYNGAIVTADFTVAVAAHVHRLTKTEAAAATCTKDGNIEYWICSGCKKLFSDEAGATEITQADTVVKATDHDWGDWVTTTPATEDAEGMETRTCKNDPSHTETRPIDKLVPATKIETELDAEGQYAGTKVEGLDAIAVDNTVPGETVKITLTVTEAEPGQETIDAIRALEGASGKTLVFLDLRLTKQVGDTVTEIHDTNGKLLKIVIPFDTSKKDTIVVYRVHDGVAEAMKEKPAQDEEGFVVGDGSITIYAFKFSIYAIGYSEQTQPSPKPSGGGGGGGVTTYTVSTPAESVDTANHGSVTADRKTIAANGKVVLTAKPDEGYKLEKLTVTDEKGNVVPLTENSDGTYTFTMPASNVTVTPVFAAIPATEPAPVEDSACPKDATCPISAFSDATPTAWYHDGVHWALEKGIMNGIGNGLFAPNDTTTRAMVVTMLWRLEGQPEGAANPFTDIPAGSWYENAANWAAETGVVKGVSDTEFAPDAPVTREQLATILYRYAKAQGKGFTGAWAFPLDYPDAAEVSEWADEAMHWMTMNGIITGMGDGTLAPRVNATRAQIATLFMRFTEAMEK